MTKAELIAAIAEVSSISKADASRFMEAFIDVLTDALLHIDSVTLTGFGTFSVKDRAKRVRYDLKTRKVITISATRVICFKPSNALKDIIKSGLII